MASSIKGEAKQSCFNLYAYLVVGNIENFHDFQGNLFKSHMKNLQMVRKAMNTIYLVPISFAAENFSYLLMFSL